MDTERNLIRDFVLKINPEFSNWEQLEWILSVFRQWDQNPAEPPSSGAFICAARSNGLAAGAAAFFACAGDKHLPFERTIQQFKGCNFENLFYNRSGRIFGFGHPVWIQDERVHDFFKTFPLAPEASQNIKSAKAYVHEHREPCLNFAGLYGLWCAENKLDERAAVLPLISRLLGMVSLYEYNPRLSSTFDAIGDYTIPTDT